MTSVRQYIDLDPAEKETLVNQSVKAGVLQKRPGFFTGPGNSERNFKLFAKTSRRSGCLTKNFSENTEAADAMTKKEPFAQLFHRIPKNDGKKDRLYENCNYPVQFAAVLPQK